MSVLVCAGSAPLSGFFIAFRGRGYVIGLIAVVCLLAADWICGLGYHDPDYYARHGWPKLTAFVFAALIVWWLDGLGREERIGVEVREGSRRTFFHEQDSLLFVPARYWPLVLIALGGVFLLRAPLGSLGQEPVPLLLSERYN